MANLMLPGPRSLPILFKSKNWGTSWTDLALVTELVASEWAQTTLLQCNYFMFSRNNQNKPQLFFLTFIKIYPVSGESGNEKPRYLLAINLRKIIKKKKRWISF